MTLRPRTLALLACLMLSLSLAEATVLPAAGGPLPPGASTVAATTTAPLSPEAPSAVAVHWGRPGSPSGPALEPRGGVPAPSAAASFCDPYRGVMGNEGVNFSVATTPANGSGPAPLRFSWAIHIGGGGLPPYRVLVYLFGPTNGVAPYSNWTGFNTTVGNATLSVAGTTLVDVVVEDSSCTQESGVQIPEFAWGVLGPHPLAPTVSPSRGTAPLNVTFDANLAGALPANWSVAWTALLGPTYGNATFGGAAQVNHTFYFPGTFAIQACLYEMPNGTWYSLSYACAPPLNVTVSGAPFTVGFARTPTPYPVNVTFWVNRTTEPLPVPTGNQTIQMSAYVWDGTTGLEGVFPENSSVTLNGTNVTCGPNWGVYFDPTGVCTLDVQVALVLTGPPNVSAPPWIDGGWLGLEEFDFNLTANVTPSQWVPTVTATWSTVNGSAPLNLTFNLSFSGGRGPYVYAYAVFGRAPAPNATFYPTLAGGQDTWNGSPLSVVLPLNQDGEYFAGAYAQDLAGHYFAFAVPLIVLNGNASAVLPLHLVPRENLTPALFPNSTEATFEVTVTGGAGPYGIQWDFGDGSFGSSLSGQPIVHLYGARGTYYPSVTVTTRGETVTTDLAPVTVAGPASTPSNSSALPSSPAGGSGGLAGTLPVLGAGAIGVATLGLVLVLAYRREIRHQGNDLLAPEAETSSDPAPP